MEIGHVHMPPVWKFMATIDVPAFQKVCIKQV
jgi:hypothetical protein